MLKVAQLEKDINLELSGASGETSAHLFPPAEQQGDVDQRFRKETACACVCEWE